MQEKHKKSNYDNELDKKNYLYNKNEDDLYYSNNPQKRIDSEKDYKKVDISLKAINNRKHNKINQKSIWGSKALNSKKYIINKNKSNSINYSNIICNYIIKKDKNQNNTIKKRNNILKCLIELNKSRKEVEGKYFDIWLDKTYYYYLTPEDNKRKTIKNYNNYDKSEKNDKKYKKTTKRNEISKNTRSNEKKYHNYYKDNSSSFYKENAFISRSKEKNNNNYINNSREKYRNTSYYNDNYYNKYKNNSQEKGKLKEKRKYKIDIHDLKRENYYDSDSFNEEYNKEKLKEKYNIRNYNKNEKSNKIFNKKLLYILTKYIIERKEKSQCFYKWLNNMSSIYIYNGEEAFNDIDGKNYLEINKKNKKIDKSKSYKIEKFYDDYEETPEINNEEENNLYIYNENRKYNKINDYFKIKNNIKEEPNILNFAISNNRGQELNSNRYNEYGTTIMTNINDNEEKISIHDKIKNLKIMKKQIKKETKLENERNNIFNISYNINKNLIRGNEYFGEEGIASPLKYNKKLDNKKIKEALNNKKNDLQKKILINILRKYKHYKLFKYVDKWFDVTFNNEQNVPYFEENNNTETNNNNAKIKFNNKILDKNYLYIGKEYIKSRNKDENIASNGKIIIKDYFKTEFNEQSFSENEDNEPQILNKNIENELGNKMIYEEKYNTIENIKEKINEKNSKEKNKDINLENLSKKEKRIYKKYKKAMHLLRKAIKSYKKRKRKGLLMIKNEEFLLKYIKKWKKLLYSEEKAYEYTNNEQSQTLKKEKIKNIINMINGKLKNNILKCLKFWHNYTFIISKNNQKKETNNAEIQKKINTKQFNNLYNVDKIFHKKKISRKKMTLDNNKNKIKNILNSKNNEKNIKNYNTKINNDNYNNNSLELNKKIKFCINDNKQKNQIIVFNNFNIKDINGRKEIIINKNILPKNSVINNNKIIKRYNESITNNNIKKKLIDTFNKINLMLIKQKYFILWSKKASKKKYNNTKIYKNNNFGTIIENELKINNKYENRNMRSNSRKIIIRQEPVDYIEEEKLMNKSYTKNEIKFNFNKIHNKTEINRNDNNINILDINLEDKKIKLKNNKYPKDKEINNNDNNEEESSAFMEDPSEINTIYSIHNIQKTNNIQQAKNNTINYNNMIIKEEKNNKKLEIENLSKNKLLLPYIYKLSFYNNNTINLTLNVLQNCNEKLFNMMNSENYVKILEKNQKLLSSYHIYCLYSLFNNGKNFYILKYAFKKWKKLLTIFNNNKENKHIRNNKGHCIGCSCKDIYLDYLKYNNDNMCFNCICCKCKNIIKSILIRHKFMKEINPKRYYLFLWYKNIFNRIRYINI